MARVVYSVTSRTRFYRRRPTTNSTRVRRHARRHRKPNSARDAHADNLNGTIWYVAV